MKIATILSNFDGITSKRFFDEYIYQIMVVRDIIKNKRTNVYPVSIDTTYEQAFNGYNQNENLTVQNSIKKVHMSSQCILVCIDRGFTEEMQSIVDLAIKNNNAEVLFYTIFPETHKIGSIVNVINNDNSIDSIQKVEIVKNFVKTLEKNNRLIFRQTGDLTNYRQKFYDEIAYTENEALLTMAASLEKKLERDTIGGKKILHNNPFEVLKNLRSKVEDRKAS